MALAKALLIIVLKSVPVITHLQCNLCQTQYRTYLVHILEHRKSNLVNTQSAPQLDAMLRELPSEEDEEEVEYDELDGSYSSHTRNSEISCSLRSTDESDEWVNDKFGRQFKKERGARVSHEKFQRNVRSLKYNLKTFEKDELPNQTNKIIPIITAYKKPKDDAKDRTDAETISQFSVTSSDDSKTYSQVYSEIYEESVTRQKNADNICKLYITNQFRMHYGHDMPEEATKHWVNCIELSMDDWTTEVSDYSDNQPQGVQPTVGKINKEMNKKETHFNNQQKSKTNAISVSVPNLLIEEMYIGEPTSTRPEYNLIDQPESWKRTELERFSKDTDDCQANKSKAENSLKTAKEWSRDQSKFHEGNNNKRYIPSFHRDEQYCTENDEKMVNRYKERRQESESWSDKFETHSKNSTKMSVCSLAQSELSSIEDCQIINGIEEPNKERNISNCAVKGRESWRSTTSYISESSGSFDNMENQMIHISRDSDAHADQSGLDTSSEQESYGNKETTMNDCVKTFQKTIYSNKKPAGETYADSFKHDKEYKPLDNPQIFNQSKKKSREVIIDETISSEGSALRNEEQRFQKRLISKNASSKRHMFQNNRTCSVTPRNKGSKQHDYETDSTANLNWGCAPIRRRSRRSRITTPKTYRDKACSPIRILSTEQQEEENEVDMEAAQSGSSSKFDLKNEFSQASISSVDKSMQYPSDDELGNDKEVLKTHELGSENDIEVLEIPQTPLTVRSDGEKNLSSQNSSYNSYRSSIASMSSYEPSVRFYRRTHAEDEDELVTLPKDRTDSHPLTYKEHVALLAERALRACTNYYNDPLETPIAKVQMCYDPEEHFKALHSQRQHDATM